MRQIPLTAAVVLFCRRFVGSLLCPSKQPRSIRWQPLEAVRLVFTFKARPCDSFFFVNFRRIPGRIGATQRIVHDVAIGTVNTTDYSPDPE